MKTMVSLVVVVLVGLEAILGAEAACLQCSKSKKPEFDFKGLSEYLAAKIATNDSEANLGQLRADVASLEPEPLRRAAELTLKLSEAQQCDDQVLALIKQAQRARLRVDGDSRVEKVVEVPLNKLFDLCMVYISDRLEPMLQLPEMIDFLKEFSAGLSSDKRQLEYMLARHGKDDPNVRCDRITNMKRHQFDSIFDTYLAHPCQQFVPMLGPLADGYDAARTMHQDSSAYLAYDKKRPAGMLDVTRAMAVCRAVLNISASKKTKMFKKFCGPTWLEANLIALRPKNST